MAGHSQFKNIMHRKGAQDAKRSQMFSKLSREITVAAKMGGADPGTNARLRLAIRDARTQSMPKDNIERAIKKAEGADSANYESVRYEGRGPGGAALIVEALTDNRNRTAGNVRSYFSKYGGALAQDGAVTYMFDRVGEIQFALSVGDADKVMEAALEAGADDVQTDADGHWAYCGEKDLHEVARQMEAVLGEAEAAKLIWKPQTPAVVDDEDSARTLMKLLEILDDDEDIQVVTGNYEFPEEIAAKLSA